jgi:hypothetical protein
MQECEVQECKMPEGKMQEQKMARYAMVVPCCDSDRGAWTIPGRFSITSG